MKNKKKKIDSILKKIDKKRDRDRSINEILKGFELFESYPT